MTARSIVTQRHVLSGVVAIESLMRSPIYLRSRAEASTAAGRVGRELTSAAQGFN